MTRLLLKFCFSGAADPARQRARAGSLSGIVGILCNLLLFSVKMILGLMTGSLSVTADAVNNLSDASGSILTLIGFRLANKPADPQHPYGHARFEYLSALAVSAMILLMGFEVGLSSLRKIFDPTPVIFTPLTLGILPASIAVKLWLCRFNRALGRAIGSNALLAVAADSRNDCIATGAVLLSGLLETFAGLRLDGIIGLGVAVFILTSGFRLARQTISPLLGEQADPELREKLLAQLRRHPKVLGYHDLMIHDYGPGQQYASVHVEMDSREDPLACHDILDGLEYACLKELGVHLVIHYDPIITDDPALEALKEQTKALLRSLDPRLNLHDFRVIRGRRHRNLVFDVPLPADLHGREEAIRAGVENGLNGSGENTFHVKITFDAPER